MNSGNSSVRSQIGSPTAVGRGYGHRKQMTDVVRRSSDRRWSRQNESCLGSCETVAGVYTDRARRSSEILTLEHLRMTNVTSVMPGPTTRCKLHHHECSLGLEPRSSVLILDALRARELETHRARFSKLRAAGEFTTSLIRGSF